MKKKVYSSPDLELTQVHFKSIMADTVRDSYQEDFKEDIDDSD